MTSETEHCYAIHRVTKDVQFWFNERKAKSFREAVREQTALDDALTHYVIPKGTILWEYCNMDGGDELPTTADYGAIAPVGERTPKWFWFLGYGMSGFDIAGRETEVLRASEVDDKLRAKVRRVAGYEVEAWEHPNVTTPPPPAPQRAVRTEPFEFKPNYENFTPMGLDPKAFDQPVPGLVNRDGSPITYRQAATFSNEEGAKSWDDASLWFRKMWDDPNCYGARWDGQMIGSVWQELFGDKK